MKKRNVVVVDLDGTLIYGDMLHESLVLFIKQFPLKAFVLLYWLIKGKAFLKFKLANFVCPNVETLTYNFALIERLKEYKKKGAVLVLATATNQLLADKIAIYLNLFDEVLGSNKNLNLSSNNKRALLEEKYKKNGFVYYGNSNDDIAVWESSAEVHIINGTKSLLKKTKAKLSQVHSYTCKASEARGLVKAMRLHQWIKNVLIFVPLLVSHQIFNLNLLLDGVFAFVTFGLCASSVYLLNDLLDVEEDREHPTKKYRPFASGRLSFLIGGLFIIILLVLSFSLALILLPIEFVFILGGYYILTVLYSFGLKKVVMLDVIILALLYSIRVVAGTEATSLSLTFWILAFSVFIFLSLAFVKRYTELFEKRAKNSKDLTPGRGYYPADFELLSSLGGSAGYISVMVLALYINEAPIELYKSPELMWISCPILLFWLSRVWLIAHRGEMHDDPIVFAVKDRVSLIAGFCFILTFFLASNI